MLRARKNYAGSRLKLRPRVCSRLHQCGDYALVYPEVLRAALYSY
jgi:hypothetical protein